ncbi:MAG TPA: hypothetical protein VIF09_18495 [Polyangiaceae bacterium]|jgi:hypothetical protein
MMTRPIRILACLVLAAAALPLGGCYADVEAAPGYYAPPPPRPYYGRTYTWRGYGGARYDRR